MHYNNQKYKKMEQMEHVPATGYIEQINITTN